MTDINLSVKSINHCIQIRHSQKIRVRETKNKVPLRVLARQGLSKFGEALLNDQNVTLQSQDFVKIEHPDDVLNEPEGDDVALGGTLTATLKTLSNKLLRNLKKKPLYEL